MVETEIVLRYVKNDSLVTSWENNVISYLNSDEAKKYIDSTEFNNQIMAFGKLHGTKGFDFKYISNHATINFAKQNQRVIMLFDSEFSKEETECIFGKGFLPNRSNLVSLIGKHFDNDTIVIGEENIDNPNTVQFKLILGEDIIEKVEYNGFKFN